MQKIIFNLIVLLCLGGSLKASQWNKEVDLRGEWYFEIGDDMQYSETDFNDSGWEQIKAPGPWEDQGFPGYDGYAWYRKRFVLPERSQKKLLYLQLGQIDDVDFVYINGTFVNSSGTVQPDYRTAYGQQRIYLLAPSCLRFGAENVIAVRVYDHELAGGIIHGPLGIYSRSDQIALAQDLSGMWKFSIGDDPNWARADFDDSYWGSIMVPAKWEPQGYEGYDGNAWYRRELVLNNNIKADERLILILGKIDDMDEVYLNGHRIGRTGRFPGDRYGQENNPFWNQERVYTIPSNILRREGKNVIAVRVYDVWLDGGIYDGPIGIMAREQWNRYRRQQPKNFNQFMDEFFRTLFR